MISKSFANSVNAAIFGGVSLDIDNWYFGFSTMALDEDGNIPDDAEPKITGYSRIPMPNTSESFNTPAYYPTSPISSVTNAKDIAFKIISGSNGSEVIVTHWFLSNSQTDNVAQVWGEFKNPISLTGSATVRIPAGNLFLTINNG